MIKRAIAAELRSLFRQFPAVALLGPRQAGKTTLAKELAGKLGRNAIYLDLELPSNRAKLSEAELYFAEHAHQLVILDEIHRAPEIFQTLRGVIDARRKNGQFLILGSASMDLLQQSSESLAGRIAYLELTPFTAREVGDNDQLWVRGGFPKSFLAANDRASFAWRQAFIRTYLERDVPALGPRVPAETLHRFWEMLAHNQGQQINAARIAGALGVTGQTVGRYLDILVDLLLVRRLPTWSANAGKRLVRTPKVYVRDSGIVHALLRIPDQEELIGHPVVGSSWEGFVIENILAALPPEAKASFYRTSNGAEIDLVIEFSSKKRWGVEVKRSLLPHPSKGFHLACDDLAVTRRIVVYPGAESYHIDAATEAMPLAMLLKKV